MQKLSLKELQKIPSVGRAIAKDLYRLGFRSVQDLKAQNPEELHARLCDIKGTQIDRCVLYVFRCAVYFASNQEHDADLLKWWNWKESRR